MTRFVSSLETTTRSAAGPGRHPCVRGSDRRGRPSRYLINPPRRARPIPCQSASTRLATEGCSRPPAAAPRSPTPGCRRRRPPDRRHRTCCEPGGERGPYFQSERLDLYRTTADRLVAGGHTYNCYCSQDELKAKREAARAAGRRVALRPDLRQSHPRGRSPPSTATGNRTSSACACPRVRCARRSRARADRVRRGESRGLRHPAIDVAPDGRFLINTELDSAAAPSTLILNWQPPATK